MVMAIEYLIDARSLCSLVSKISSLIKLKKQILSLQSALIEFYSLREPWLSREVRQAIPITLIELRAFLASSILQLCEPIPRMLASKGTALTQSQMKWLRAKLGQDSLLSTE